MEFSQLKEIRQSKSYVNNFYGYRHKQDIRDGEFYDMENMSSDNFPALSPRKGRGTITETSFAASATGLAYKDELIYTNGTNIHIGQNEIDLGLNDEQKTLVSMGAYVIILPDMKYVNTKDLDEYGDINESISWTDFSNYQLCDNYGNEINVRYTGTSAPQTAPDGAYWLDTSNGTTSLKRYSGTTSMWTLIPNTYIRLFLLDPLGKIRKHDGVKITGIENVEGLNEIANKTITVTEVYKDDNGDTSFVFLCPSVKQEYGQLTGAVSIERTAPIMDFVIESGNRLWGCRYGLNRNGEFVNEIYATRLGTYDNWNCFEGTAMDSYTVSIGTDGAFTGAIDYNGFPLFFKEDCVHKISGQMPSNFSLQVFPLKGVVKGASRSLAIINEMLYYKTKNGVGAFNGMMTTEMTDPFGDIKYTATDDGRGALAGTDGDKYYINMKSEKDGKWYLFVYDTLKNMWHKEEQIKINMMCSHNGTLYYQSDDEEDNQFFHTMVSDESDRKVKWMAETGALGTHSARTYISKIMLRMMMSEGSRVMIYIQYDSSGEWEHVTTMVGTTLRTFSLPVRPRRCDHFKLRVTGEGEAKIYSMTKTIEEGSDI